MSAIRAEGAQSSGTRSRRQCQAFRIAGTLCALLTAAPTAQAGLRLAPVIVDFAPGQPPRADMELFNDGDDRLYIVVEPSKIEAPGTNAEKRVQNVNPEVLGLFATPNRLILEPGQRKFVRIAMLADAGDQDRIYRVTIKPVVGLVKASVSGLKILVGYDALVIQRPTKPNANITAERSKNALLLRNSGNTNAELFDGKQCDSDQHCSLLPGHRIYAGSTWTVTISPNLPVEYLVKVGRSVVSQRF